MGFEPPSWEALDSGARPTIREPDEFEPGGVRQGWQHEAASRDNSETKSSSNVCLPKTER